VGQLGEQADNVGGTESESVSALYKWECSTRGGRSGPREITRGTVVGAEVPALLAAASLSSL
jgi:hypothetical protein